jgi:hypothetical protein
MIMPRATPTPALIFAALSELFELRGEEVGMVVLFATLADDDGELLVLDVDKMFAVELVEYVVVVDEAEVLVINEVYGTARLPSIDAIVDRESGAGIVKLAPPSYAFVQIQFSLVVVRGHPHCQVLLP